MLRAIAYIKPKINYCQGMNYIAAFLYVLTKDEAETFYLLLGLFENTDFGLIFVEDLLRLKIFFYVFERLLLLYLPELHNYFKINTVIVNFFCSPWFITLFTNACPFLAINKEQPKVIMKIWDEFLLSGWKSIMKTGICLMKNFENTLISFKYEDLLHFLINDLIKSGYFMNGNYSKFVKEFSLIRIKIELINNLENECIQDIKIKEAEEKIRKIS